MKESEIRIELVETCLNLYQRGMVSSINGNVSVRVNHTVFITPTGKSLGRLDPPMIVKTDLAGNVIDEGKPSIEGRLHLAIYENRKDVNAVVHVHPSYSVSVSCTVAPQDSESLPPLTPGYAVIVGKLPLVKYYRPGSPELRQNVVRFLKDGNAVLLQNHGVVAVGKELKQAVNIAEEVEENAKIYVLTNKKARVLTPKEIQELSGSA